LILITGSFTNTMVLPRTNYNSSNSTVLPIGRFVAA
jgi:hypothetical protein